MRSSHTFTAWRWGHKWVVLAVLVRLPGTGRPWALPLLVALYRPAAQDRRSGRRHKTCPEWMRQMRAVRRRWFPQRQFRLAGDGGYATHALARFAHRHRSHLTLVSRFYPEAHWYAPASVARRGRKGRPRCKGRKWPSPAAVVAATRKRTRLTVSWYGGEPRRVEMVSGVGLMPVRWVYVQDLSGTHRDEYFFTTDVDLTPRAILEGFTGRWAIEVTCEELRAYLGLETTRGWTRATVLRVAHISHNAWAQNPLFVGSSLMWVDIDADVSLKDLFYGVVISSGNDASVAIAEHLAGSEDSFASLMNAQAKRLGMNNSHFVNAHGLPQPEHYTTARDLAILSHAIIFDHPQDYAVYSQVYYNFNNIRQMNRNELLGEQGVDGIKTGHTDDAGYCLVTSALENGMRLIAVVLGTDSKLARKEESRKLLSYGFRTYETRKLFSAGQQIATQKVWAGASDTIALGAQRDIYLTVPRGQFDALVANSSLDPVLKAPVAAGDEHGKLSVKLADVELLNEPLVATGAVERGNFFRVFWDSLMLFFLQLFGKV